LVLPAWVIAHELAHELLHKTNREGTTRQQRELESKSVDQSLRMDMDKALVPRETFEGEGKKRGLENNGTVPNSGDQTSAITIAKE
jgi:hypothetical protein